MKHYDYTPELENVLAYLKEVKDVKKHEKLYAKEGIPESHKPILRREYKRALRQALFNLSLALAKWEIDGYKIENGDKEVRA